MGAISSSMCVCIEFLIVVILYPLFEGEYCSINIVAPDLICASYFVVPLPPYELLLVDEYASSSVRLTRWPSCNGVCKWSLEMQNGTDNC